MEVLSLRDYREQLAKLEVRIARTDEALRSARANPRISLSVRLNVQEMLEEDRREANRLRALIACLEKESRRTP